MERWLPVVGFEGRYEVSDAGRVRSVDRIIIQRRRRDREPVFSRRIKGRIRVLCTTNDGYHQVKLTAESQSVLVHVLVLQAFMGPCPAGQQGRHIDDVGTNNFLNNLEWGTPLQNADDRARNGRTARGERQGCAKLTTDDIVAIRSRAMSETPRQIADDFEVTSQNIRHIANRKTWKHVP